MLSILKMLISLCTEVLHFTIYCRFAGGTGDGNSHIGEGLATALQMFDDLATVHEPKYVFMY